MAYDYAALTQSLLADPIDAFAQKKPGDDKPLPWAGGSWNPMNNVGTGSGTLMGAINGGAGKPIDMGKFADATGDTAANAMSNSPFPPAKLPNVLPGFADGGITYPGQLSLVGEGGPELIQSDSPAVVTPLNLGGDAPRLGAGLRDMVAPAPRDEHQEYVDAGGGTGFQPNTQPSPSLNTGLTPMLPQAPIDPRKQMEDNLRNTISKYQDKSAGIDPTTGAPVHRGFWGGLGHALAQTGAWQNSGTMKAQRAAEAQREGTLSNLTKEDTENTNAQSLAGLRTAQEEYNKAHANAVDLHIITPQEAEAMGNVDLAGQQMTEGVFQHLTTTKDNNQTKITTTQMQDDTKDNLARLKASMATLKPEQRDDHAIRLMQMKDQGQTLSPTDASYLKAYGQYVDQNKVQPGVQRMMTFAKFAPVQVVGQDGNVIYANRITAQGQEAPSSIPFRTMMGMAKYMTSGNGGKVITAYNTALNHLELLDDGTPEHNGMIKALANGDYQTFNRLGNAFAKETGSPAPTDFNAVRDMVSGELANVAASNGATIPEIDSMRKDLEQAGSPEQLQGVVNDFHKLLMGKAVELYHQNEAGMQGQPAFNPEVKKQFDSKHPQPAAPQIPTGASQVGHDANGNVVGYVLNGKWVPIKATK